MRKLLILIPALFLSLNIFAQDILPDNPRGFVNDYANMLSSSEINRLERKLSNYRDTTSNVIAIATIESLQGNSIEEVATLTFSKWALYEGNAGERDNGVLLLISKGDRAFKIEVGYGLEGAITDAMSSRILNDILTPNFQQGNYYGGIDRATDAMIQLAAGEFEGFSERRTSNGEGGSIPLDVIILIVVIIIVLISRGRGGKHGGGKRTLSGSDVLLWGLLSSGPRRGGGSSFGGGGSFGGGSSFGGFGGGGGFGSGGGGASGGW